jgi:hypothetical protein
MEVSIRDALASPISTTGEHTRIFQMLQDLDLHIFQRAMCLSPTRQAVLQQNEAGAMLYNGNKSDAGQRSEVETVGR